MNRALSGTRGAAHKREIVCREFLFSKGVGAGISTPCVFWHPERNMRVVVRGGGFTVLASRDQLDWCRRRISSRFDVKFRGRMGPGENTCKIMRILNRVVEWMNRGLAHGQTKGMLN